MGLDSKGGEERDDRLGGHVLRQRFDDTRATLALRIGDARDLKLASLDASPDSEVTSALACGECGIADIPNDGEEHISGPRRDASRDTRGGRRT